MPLSTLPFCRWASVSAHGGNDQCRLLARRPSGRRCVAFPTGVTVVTTLKEGEPRGITVNAFASVSLDPPSLLICINREARSYLFISSSRDLLRQRARRRSTTARRAFLRKSARPSIRRDRLRDRHHRRTRLGRHNRAFRLRARLRIPVRFSLDSDRTRGFVRRASRLAARDTSTAASTTSAST